MRNGRIAVANREYRRATTTARMVDVRKRVPAATGRGGGEGQRQLREVVAKCVRSETTGRDIQ
jgi:hypothetical protein